MRRPRFSLRLLLIAVTAIAAYFGAAQVHRRNMRRAIDRFESQGTRFQVDASWVDAVWMRRPRMATIVLTLHPATGQLQLGDRTFPSSDGSGEQIADLKRRLEDFGVTKVSVDLQRR